MYPHEVESIVQEIATKSKISSQPKSIYLMRKEWDDKMFVLEYEDRYVMHNWHTSE